MSTNLATAPAPQQQSPSLLAKLAGRFSVEPNKMLATLKATAFKVKDGDVSNEQMMALLIVADQYGLNPFTKEIFAFPDQKGIVPVVGVDGWARIINQHDQFDGLEFLEAEHEADQIPAWIECVIYRKDRAHPVKVREYYSEVKRSTGPWGSHPRRMLRHKAMIQCARLAFGYSGIYDQDEAERIVEGQRVVDFDMSVQSTGSARLKQSIKAKQAAPETIDATTGEIDPLPSTAPAAEQESDFSALEQRIPLEKAIETLATHNDIELMALYADSLQNDYRQNEQFAKAYRLNMDRLKETEQLKNLKLKK